MGIFHCCLRHIVFVGVALNAWTFFHHALLACTWYTHDIYNEWISQCAFVLFFVEHKNYNLRLHCWLFRTWFISDSATEHTQNWWTWYEWMKWIILNFGYFIIGALPTERNWNRMFGSAMTRITNRRSKRYWQWQYMSFPRRTHSSFQQWIADSIIGNVCVEHMICLESVHVICSWSVSFGRDIE